MTNILCTIVITLSTNWTDLHVDVHQNPNRINQWGGMTLLGWDPTPTRIQAGLISSNVVALVPWNGVTNQLVLESTRLTNVLTRTIKSTDPQAAKGDPTWDNVDQP